jgi:hypothetical protein
MTSMTDRASRVPLVAKVLAGAMAGFVVGWLAGALLLRALFGTTGAASGWEDLAGVAASLFSFAPVGALVGGLVGARSRVAPWWRDLPRPARHGAIAGAMVVLVAGLAVSPWAGVESAVPAAVAASPLGAGVGLAVGRRAG